LIRLRQEDCKFEASLVYIARPIPPPKKILYTNWKEDGNYLKSNYPKNATLNSMGSFLPVFTMHIHELIL
jgi:hypothetical protein